MSKKMKTDSAGTWLEPLMEAVYRATVGHYGVKRWLSLPKNEQERIEQAAIKAFIKQDLVRSTTGVLRDLLLEE